MVIGAGPAGMKAAETLAARGHEVELFEKADVLGGQVNVIVKIPRRESFNHIIKDGLVHLRKHGVKIHTNTEVNAAMVADFNPDGVIVATGSTPLRSGFSSVAPLVDNVPGVDQHNVITVFEALIDPSKVGKQVLILDDDGTRYAAGTAEALLSQGHTVHVVTRFSSLAPFTVPTLDQPILYNKLFTLGLQLTLNHWVREIRRDSAVVYNLYSGADQTIQNIDTVILATGHKANDTLYLALKAKMENVHRIGDALAPRRIEHAVYEGVLAGRELFDNSRYIESGELEFGDTRA